MALRVQLMHHDSAAQQVGASVVCQVNLGLWCRMGFVTFPPGICPPLFLPERGLDV